MHETYEIILKNTLKKKYVYGNNQYSQMHITKLLTYTFSYIRIRIKLHQYNFKQLLYY